ncbi:TetR/AcrR family transcriptional regulator [Anaeromyxobacter sp. SG66]|uniref:TetR/AcrR family transcriptional regulator n=1 Tax=Anaeromyxobacter sp. SG66 TaxID=2925410 RepID=UPI001F5AF905|nr:TetR/AcrR family transcriptional regulator [Anaeromyxobacter sp. SG66]
MAQYLKEDIQESISSAALTVFAQKGYSAATMTEIAEAAGISTGNIYRYFQDKKELFRAVVSDEFARTFTELIRQRVNALDGVDDVRALEVDAPYHLISEELLRFCIENRLRVVVLLGKAQGTNHEPFAEKMVHDLVKMTIAHARSTRPTFDPKETTTFSLDLVYRNFVSAMASILTRFKDEAKIREAVAGLSHYHLAGLKSFFEGASLSSRVRR